MQKSGRQKIKAYTFIHQKAFMLVLYIKLKKKRKEKRAKVYGKPVIPNKHQFP